MLMAYKEHSFDSAEKTVLIVKTEMNFCVFPLPSKALKDVL